jgi:iron(III) transport system ATP-binding protein
MSRAESAGRPEHTSEPVAAVQNLVKTYTRARHDAVRALDGVTLDFLPGEFVVLLGPSGCGKTTLLRSIAGLERPDGGSVRLRSETVFAADEGVYQPPEARGLSMMFQSYALWPNMTVAENVRYPLRSRRAGKRSAEGGRVSGRLQRAEANDLMRAALRMVGIPELEDRYPNQLSGGQQQRVALARALVWRDDIVLFDEPLSNVDAKVRDDLRRELTSMQHQLGFTGIYVTHDQTEAMQLGDRIVVMRAGRIEQQGRPEDIYLRPRNRFVANFVGASNEVPGRVSWISPDGARCEVETGVGRMHGRLPEGSTVASHEEVVASWRPESTTIGREEPTVPNKWRVTLVDPVFIGTHTECAAHLGEHRVRLLWPLGESFTADDRDETWVGIDPDRVSVLPASGA